MVTPDAEQYIKARGEFAARMEKIGKPVEYQKGATIFRLGEPSSSLHLITDGLVGSRVFVRGGEEFVQYTAQPVEIFGAEDLFQPVHSSSALALQDSRVIEVPRSNLRTEMFADPELVEYVLTAVTLQIGYQETKCLVSKPKKAPDKVATALIAIYGDPDRVPQSPHQPTIAMVAGMARETVGRVLPIARERIHEVRTQTRPSNEQRNGYAGTTADHLRR